MRCLMPRTTCRAHHVSRGSERIHTVTCEHGHTVICEHGTHEQMHVHVHVHVCMCLYIHEYLPARVYVKSMHIRA